MAVAPEALAPERYTRTDLRELRLEGLPFLLVVLYLASLVFALLPLDAGSQDRFWLAALSPALLVGFYPLWQRSPQLAGAGLVGGLTALWVAALWSWPGDPLVWASLLLVGTTSALLGPKLAMATGVLDALVLAAAGAQGVVPESSAVVGLFGLGVGSCLFWLAARPSDRTLEWAWVSYADARDKRDELRRHQGELNALLKSLDLAYHRLEHLNDELSRARTAAEAARRLKSEFAANISHELRTPLNLIIGFSEILAGAARGRRGRIPPALQADVDVIYRNAQHLSELIDDVLDLSQVEAGRMGLTREEVALGTVVDEAASAVAVRIELAGLALRIEVAPGLPPVQVDRARMRQVLINLLNNAARFTDVGGITVSAARRDNELLVTVADTGVGIAPTDLPHLFDEFYQTESALARRAGGSGLGLTISKRFVELHGGAMWAESTPGVGSSFFFTLPLADSVVTGLLPGEWSLWDRVARGHEPASPTIAVVADEATFRTVRRYLDNYQALPAADLGGAAQLARERDVRGVLLAAESPTALWRQLCRAGDTALDLPIGVCTTSSAGDRAADLEAVDYLSKPVSRDRLKQALRRLGPSPGPILVVDDNADMVRLLTRTIRGLGRHEVWQAFGGEEALAIVRQRRPGAVLLDLLMPDVDGYAVLAAMRADPATASTPVVIVSARGAGAEGPTTGFVGITRAGGLSVGEMMRCLESCFSALQPRGADRSAPAPPAAPIRSPASAAARRPREPGPAPVPAAPST
jgi:signal transduction histidine kinase/CheY-like chemotaxis protein